MDGLFDFIIFVVIISSMISSVVTKAKKQAADNKDAGKVDTDLVRRLQEEIRKQTGEKPQVREIPKPKSPPVSKPATATVATPPPLRSAPQTPKAQPTPQPKPFVPRQAPAKPMPKPVAKPLFPTPQPEPEVVGEAKKEVYARHDQKQTNATQSYARKSIDSYASRHKTIAEMHSWDDKKKKKRSAKRKRVALTTSSMRDGFILSELWAAPVSMRTDHLKR